jgi:Short C-terminal domain
MTGIRPFNTSSQISNWILPMSRFSYLIPIVLIGCSSAGVVKIGDNLYTVSEKSQPLQAAAEHIPDPAIDDINNAAKDYCNQYQQRVKTLSMDSPTDPTIRQENFKLTFSCVNPENTSVEKSTLSPNAQRLEELKKLRDQGVISESEFETKRTQILNQM